jgi:hypothetical protein
LECGDAAPGRTRSDALDWGDALWATHDYAEAVRAFELGIDAVREVDSELALRIEAHAMAAARLDLGTCGLVSTRLKRFASEPPATPAGRLLAGVLAIERALAGEPRPEVIALVERMLENLPIGRVGAQIPLFATNALLWSRPPGRRAPPARRACNARPRWRLRPRRHGRALLARRRSSPCRRAGRRGERPRDRQERWRARNPSILP